MFTFVYTYIHELRLTRLIDVQKKNHTLKKIIPTIIIYEFSSNIHEHNIIQYRKETYVIF